MQNRNNWLFLRLLGYFDLIILFAFLYFYAYESNPANFTFNSDITKNQSDAIKLSLEQQSADIKIKLKALQPLWEEINKNQNLIKPEKDGLTVTATVVTPEYKYAFETFADVSVLPGVGMIIASLKIYDNKEELVAKISYEPEVEHILGGLKSSFKIFRIGIFSISAP